jgi:hypothetical protein
MKYAEDIVKEINERGPIKIPEGYVTGEDFDIWMHSYPSNQDSKNSDNQTSK